ncbi:MAG: hypothetical protein Tsb0013_00550 [Phycisphaerales bacterium]
MLTSLLRSAGIGAALLIATAGLARTALATDPAQAIEQGAALLEAGQVVEAREVLAQARLDAEGEDRARAMRLLTVADEQMRSMSRPAVSIQRAELALKQGDLVRAEMHAEAARRADGATLEQRSRASALMDEAALRRVELEPMIEGALLQAVRDFENGNYAEAKAGFGAVARVGASLSPQDEQALKTFQDRLIALEQERGVPFRVEYTPMGVLSGEGARVVQEAVAATAIAQNGQDDPMAGGVRAIAEQLLAEANAAFEAGRYAEAVRKYNMLLDEYAGSLSDDEFELAAQRRAASTSQLGAPGESTAQTVQDQREIARQQAIATVENLVQQAENLLGQGRTREADDLASQAILSWQNARQNFSEDQYQARLEQLNALSTRIDQREEAILIEQRDEISQQIADDAAAEQRRAEERRRREIADALDRIYALHLEQKYSEALDIVDQVLFKDPNNSAALLARDVLQQRELEVEWEEIQRQKSYGYAKESLEIEKALAIPTSALQYPPDWPEISVRRGTIRSFTESEEDRRVLATLESRRIPARFDEFPLEDVLTFLSGVTNLNIDPDWDSLAEVNVSRDSRVSLDLSGEITAKVVLERVLEKISIDEFESAGYAVQDGIVVIASDEDLDRRVFPLVYDVRDLLFQFDENQPPQALDLDNAIQGTGQGGGGAGGGGGGQGLFGGGGGGDDDDLDLGGGGVDIEEIQEIIEDQVDPDAWIEGTSRMRPFRGDLIITTTSRNHRDIQGLLDQLREVRTIQILVEGRVLTVATDFFEQIGFDLDIYFNAENDAYNDVLGQLVGFGGAVPGSTGNLGLLPSQIPGAGVDADGDGTIDTVDVQAYVRQPDGTLALQTVSSPVPAQNGLSTVPATQNSLGIVDDLLGNATDFAVGVASNSALSLAGTFLDDIQVDFLVEATQADQRNVTLSAPRLTFPNGGTSFIRVQTQEAFISDLTPVTGAGSGAFDPVVGTVPSGFQLALNGVVSADRRYVNLNVVFQLSQLLTLANSPTFGGAAGGGGTVGGNAGSFGGSIQLPTITVTDVRTGVTVPDKGTILLGGQRLSEEFTVESGVPVLSKIPLINRFFTNTATAKSESTLLIMLRPEILLQNEREDDAFPGLRDRLDSQSFLP